MNVKKYGTASCSIDNKYIKYNCLFPPNLILQHHIKNLRTTIILILKAINTYNKYLTHPWHWQCIYRINHFVVAHHGNTRT